MVSSLINVIIMAILHVLGFIYVISVIEKKNINYKNFKTYILCIIAVILSVLIFEYFDNLLRPITMFVGYSLVFKKLFNIKLSESIINCFFAYIISAIAEVLELILIFIVLKIPDNIVTTYLLNKALGSFISIILVILFTKALKKVLIKIKNAILNDTNTNFIWIMIVSLSAFISLYVNNLKFNLNFLMTSICCSLIIIIIFLLFKEIVDKNDIKSEYDKLFNYTENTESLLTKYQKYNHENKNQLILIRETLNNKKETRELINEILEDDVEHTNKWLNELKNIPNGGLKGLISYKINFMTDKGINVYVSISPRLKEIKLSDFLNIKTYRELCQMIGVYMDNAYEASSETKEKNVSVEMFYQDGILNLVISNTFNKKIDLNLIDKPGYSTKGKGRGIGLSLVKDIVDKNDNINVNREIIKNYYYQYITINVSN